MQVPAEAFNVDASDKAVAAKDLEAYCWNVLDHLGKNADRLERRWGPHYVTAAMDRVATPLLRLKLGGLSGLTDDDGDLAPQDNAAAAAAFNAAPPEDPAGVE